MVSWKHLSPCARKETDHVRAITVPVSLTCVSCKFLEHIVCPNSMAHLDDHKHLSDRQHAFRKIHNCETRSARVINGWAKILDNKGQVDTFIMDLKRHLIHPLKNSGFVGCPTGQLSWSLDVLFGHKRYLDKHCVWNKTFCWLLCFLSWNQG